MNFQNKNFFFFIFLFLVIQQPVLGQFGDAQLIRSGSGITSGESIDFSDLNGDGLLDLITSDNHIYFHQTDTTLAKPIELAGMQKIVRVEDMTDDGHPDIFATHYVNNSADEQMHLFVNDGNGNFTDFPIDAYDPEHILTGDFDGNGKRDFLMKNEDTEESFLLSQTDTSDQLFSPFPIQMHSNQWGSSQLAYDSDGDGKDELWYVSGGFISTSPSLGVFITNFSADGTSTDSLVLPTTFTDSRDDIIEIADINNDGVEEVVYFHVNDFSENIKLYSYILNSSGYPAEEPFFISSTLNYNEPLFVPHLLDVDGDQLLDIVNQHNERFVFPSLTFENRWADTWFSNKGGFNFVRAPDLASFDGHFVDLNSDGFLDMLVKNSGKYEIIFNVFDYLDQLSRQGYTPDSNEDSAIKKHYFHDLDGDGFDDLVIEDNISLYYRKFLPDQNLYGHVFPLVKDTELKRSLGFLDLDNIGSSDFYVYDDQKLYRFTNFNQGIFNDVELVLDSVFIYMNDSGEALADLDNDGDMDLIGSYGINALTNPIHWWSNENGTFVLQDELLPSNQQVKLQFLHDTDLDGDVDIIFYNDEDDNYQLLENINGTTEFSAPVVLTILGTSDDVDIFHLTTNTENKIYGYGRLNDFQNRRRVAYKFENNTFTLINQSPPALNIRILTSELIDLDNNGLLELVFVEDDLSMLKSVEIQPDGTMGPTQILYENINLGGLAFPSLRNLNFHDTDNDGDLDFTTICRDASVATSFNSFLLKWYENLGSPTEWKNRYSLLPTTRVADYFYADIDQDNDLDLVKHFYDRLSWLENYDGLGNFATERVILALSESLPLNNPANTVEDDFNQDGFVDIVTPENLENLAVQYHSGTTNPYQSNQLISTPLAFENIDKFSSPLFDNDAFPDLLAIQDDNKIIAASNNGASNGFSDWVTLHEVSNNTINGYQSINIAGDAAASLVIFQPYQLSYRRSTDNSLEVGPPIELTIRPVAPQKFSGVVGDIDNDGDDDIIVMVFDDPSATYWFEQVGGTEVFAPSKILFDYSLSSFDLAHPSLIDIDQNGLLDIISRNGIVKQVAPLIFTYATYLDTGFNKELTFGDVNQDGQIDFLHEDGWWDHTISVEGEGTCFGVVGAPNLLAIRDADADGDSDIIVSSGGSVFYEDNTLINGQADFDQQISFINSNVANIQFADIDGDGSDNLIFDQSTSFRFYFFKDDNGFNEPQPIQVRSGLSSLGDVDGDGDLDVLYRNDDVFINFRITDYLFTPQMVIPATAGFEFNYIRFSDQNEDGLLDIITMETSGIYVFFNQGATDFGNPTLLYGYPDGELIFGSFDQFHLTDLDNDGKTDIVFENDDQFYLLFHESGLNYSVQTIKEDNLNYKIADVDDDQLQDLIYVGNHGDHFFKAAIQDTPREFSISEKYYELEDNISLQSIRSFKLADLDNDADLDLVYTINKSLTTGQSLYWAENVTNSSKIQGDIFYDANQNGIRDSLEVGLDRIGAVLNQESIYEFEQIDGRYKFALSPGDYTLIYEEDSLWRLTTADESYNIDIPVNPLITIEDLDFGFFPAIDQPDLQSSITSGFTRCNTVVPFWVEAINQGTQMNEGSLIFDIPSSVVVDSFNIEPNQVIGDSSFIWNFNPLFFDEKFSVRAFLLMPPATSLGDTLDFTAITNYNDTTNDTLITNKYAYHSELRCAYDPNDKLVNPNRPGEENYTLFEEQLEYTIRFQNTGNDTAFNVQITDTLDINLDWTTFRPISASHPYTYTRKEKGIISFDFDNIMLPDSNVNLIGSQGFVKFNIHPNSDLPENLVIENTAHIYFDFNDAIVTNTINNTMVSVLPVPTSTINIEEETTSPKKEITVRPNPSNGIFTFKIPPSYSLPLVLNIYNVLGNEIKTINVTNKTVLLQDKSLSNGIYFFRFKNADNKLIQSGKLMIQK